MLLSIGLLSTLTACFERELVIEQKGPPRHLQPCEHLSMNPRLDRASYQAFHSTEPNAVTVEVLGAVYMVAYQKGTQVTEARPNGSTNEYRSPASRIATYHIDDFTIECLRPSEIKARP